MSKKSSASRTPAHSFSFARTSGFDQVILANGADITAVAELDEKLWVALAVPTRGVELDDRTLDLIDADDDGRIRVQDVRGAVSWMASVLKNMDDLTKRSGVMPLSALDASKPEGARVLASTQQILRNLGKGSETSIAVDDVADPTQIFAGTRFNGDGIITAASTEDEAVQQAIGEIVEALEGVTDRSGDLGVDTDQVTAFFDAAQAFSDWHAQAESAPGEILPLGDGTAAAVAAVEAVEVKVNDYFTRCRLTAFDPRAGEHLSGAEAEWVAIGNRTLSATDETVADFPLAHPQPERALPLGTGVNPAWAAPVAALLRDAVTPIVGARTELAEADWSVVVERLAAHRAWQASKAGTEVEGLGLERVRALLAGEVRAELEALIASDEALRAEAEGIDAAEKTVRLYRDLHQLLQNFVNFSDFYGKRELAIFQAGTLLLDGRGCELVLRVDNPAAHAKLAKLSYAYLAYCTCVRPKSGEKCTIVAAFTDGDSDHLMVGRNGVYYDRDGNEWDATITKVATAPMSIRQAFWAPYKRFGKMIGDQLEKFGSSRDKAMTAQASKNISSGAKKTSASAKPGAKPPAKTETTAFDVGKFAGIFAAVGLAIGFLATAMVALVGGFFNLTWWQMPLAIGGIMLLISGPSMLLAWLKLRQRSLAPVLDASGWAINSRVRLNVPFGKTLTAMATIPENATRTLDDPYGSRSVWPAVVTAVILLGGAGYAAWHYGLFG